MWFEFPFSKQTNIRWLHIKLCVCVCENIRTVNLERIEQIRWLLRLYSINIKMANHLMKGKAGSAQRTPDGNLCAEFESALAKPFWPAGVIKG